MHSKSNFARNQWHQSIALPAGRMQEFENKMAVLEANDRGNACLQTEMEALVHDLGGRLVDDREMVDRRTAAGRAHVALQALESGVRKLHAELAQAAQFGNKDRLDALTADLHQLSSRVAALLVTCGEGRMDRDEERSRRDSASRNGNSMD